MTASSAVGMEPRCPGRVRPCATSFPRASQNAVEKSMLSLITPEYDVRTMVSAISSAMANSAFLKSSRAIGSCASVMGRIACRPGTIVVAACYVWAARSLLSPDVGFLHHATPLDVIGLDPLHRLRRSENFGVAAGRVDLCQQFLVGTRFRQRLRQARDHLRRQAGGPEQPVPRGRVEALQPELVHGRHVWKCG